MGVKADLVASDVMAVLWAIATKILTRRLLRRGARYGRKSGSSGLGRTHRFLIITSKLLMYRFRAGERGTANDNRCIQ